MTIAIVSCAPTSPLTYDDWYFVQNQKFVGRYRVLWQRLGMTGGAKFYIVVQYRAGSDYLYWAFMCGHQEDLQAVARLKVERRARLDTLTDQRIRRVLSERYFSACRAV